ncbi:DUF2721 domain-containing protein [Breznakiella homolactica]|uniref:DUF2721 domain-containing protein n=1 Tax=Breznakiella homolactica TaxID=2798577 RepID=A0A7T7XPL7_9SPIR|nr:DUF2721 domain-containing protein [Breznakiella homolactica]QQO10057.1 DUF2721 domain-containing protein [Breznakiella homolactica]
MEFNITTPALLFSAISLLMLAFTNRFLAISSLIRQFISIYTEKPEEHILKQINNFRVRLSIIKYTQLFGVLSFFFCVFCMFLALLSYITLAEILFAVSLVLMMVSLLFSLYEIFISIGALKLELDKLSMKSTQ